MIIATAGHVDHGKTALIKALTGIDTDRLPEEKARGLSIDLGFAYQAVDDETTIGFIDVPGHERFIRNMLAGVAGIDVGLLVVAADDGIMPQTVEHTAILSLLGVNECVVAITKIDRVEAGRVKEVAASVQALLEHRSMARAPIFPVCAPEGRGTQALKDALWARAIAHTRRRAGGFFRLAIDRCFSLHGVGVIVTGTAFSGSIEEGDRLLLSPAGTEVRVRSIHAQNQKAPRATAGQRCALNVVGRGVGESSIQRGDWVVDPRLHAPSDRLDARLHVLDTEPRALKHWTPVHVHLGATHRTGRIAVLVGGSIAPGDSGLVQIVLDEATIAVGGDRVVVRDQSATRTMAGGVIVDPASPRRGRARPERLRCLAAMEQRDDTAALHDLLDATPPGVTLEHFQRSRNIEDAPMDAILGALDARILGSSGSRLLVATRHWDALAADIIATLTRWHEAHPDVLGPGTSKLRYEIGTRVNQDMLDAVLDDLVTSGRVARRSMAVHLPEHRPRLRKEDALLWPKVRQALSPKSGSPPSLHQAAEQLRLEVKALEQLLKRATSAGLLLPVTKNRYVPVGSIQRWAKAAEALATEADGFFTAAQFRDHNDVGRNFAIDLLEFFDRSGFTERLGDNRRIRHPAEKVFGSTA